jgi:hypothetical protein
MNLIHYLLKMEPTQCSETSAFNTQTPGKYPEDNLSLQQHGESLKTRNTFFIYSDSLLYVPAGSKACAAFVPGIMYLWFESKS